MIKDKPLFKGIVHLQRWDGAGNLVQDVWNNNLVVTSGLNWVASRLEGVASAVMSHIAVGTDSTAAAAGNTALGGELARVALTSGVATGATITYITTFAAGEGTGAIQEAGIFNAGAGGTMLARVTFPVINKGASDTLQISWSIEATV